MLLAALGAAQVGASQAVRAEMYGDWVLRPGDRLVIRRERVSPGYRSAPKASELIVDGRAFPVEMVREIVLGYDLRQRWTVYLVVAEHVVLVAPNREPESSVELAELLGSATGAPVVSGRVTAQMVGGRAMIGAFVLFFSVELCVVFGAFFLILESGAAAAALYASGLAASMLVMNIAFRNWVGARMRKGSGEPTPHIDRLD